MSKFVKNIRRVLENGGSIDIVNSRKTRLDISEEIFQFLIYTDSLESENIKLKTKIESDKKKISILDKYKIFVEDLKTRKQILESNAVFKSKKNIRRMNKDSTNLSLNQSLPSADEELLDIFELMEKMKI